MNNAQTAAIIKSICKAKGITVSLLLSECNIRKGLIYDMEKRDWTPSAELLEKIADYLDCSVDYLLGRTDNKEEIQIADFIAFFEKLTLEQQELVLSQLNGILSAKRF